MLAGRQGNESGMEDPGSEPSATAAGADELDKAVSSPSYTPPLLARAPPSGGSRPQLRHARATAPCPSCVASSSSSAGAEDCACSQIAASSARAYLCGLSCHCCCCFGPVFYVRLATQLLLWVLHRWRWRCPHLRALLPRAHLPLLLFRVRARLLFQALRSSRGRFPHLRPGPFGPFSPPQAPLLRGFCQNLTPQLQQAGPAPSSVVEALPVASAVAMALVRTGARAVARSVARS